MATLTTRIPRELAAQYGQQAVQIIQQGAYHAPSGRLVSIADRVARSVQGTVSYPPDRPLPQTHIGSYQTHIEVANETTLAAAQRLRESGHHPVALNFASATHSGGGYPSGARAQTERLAAAQPVRFGAGDTMATSKARLFDAFILRQSVR